MFRMIIRLKDLNAKSFHERTLLHLAVIFHNITLVKFLLEKNSEFNNQDLYGFTPLDYCKNEEIEKLLIERGARNSGNVLNIEIDEGYKMLDMDHQKFFWSVYSNDLPLVQFYLIKGCNFRTHMFDHKTVLDLAICRGHLKMVKFLVKHWPNRVELEKKVEFYLENLKDKKYDAIKDYLEDACCLDDEF